MHPHAIHELDALQRFGTMCGRVEVLLGHDRWFFDEAVFYRPPQRIVHNHVLERDRGFGTFCERRRRQLQPQERLQLIQGADARACPVTVRLIHDEYQVGQARQIFKVALPQILGQPLDTRHLATPHLRIDLRDVENIDLNPVKQAQAAALFVVIASNDLRHRRRKLRDAFEHILRRIGREIPNQLVVDRQVWRQYKKVPVAIGGVQVADERPHQPRFPHAGCQGKTHRRKLALEVRQCGELCNQCGDHRRQLFRRPGFGVAQCRHGFEGAMQTLQALGLRRP